MDLHGPGIDGSALTWKDVGSPLSFVAGAREVPEPLNSGVLGALALPWWGVVGRGPGAQGETGRVGGLEMAGNLLENGWKMAGNIWLEVNDG